MSVTSYRFRAAAITELMRHAGLTASELARRIGLSRQAVWAYGAGVTTPQFATVLKLSEVAGEPLSFFIERLDAREPGEAGQLTQRVDS